MRILLSRNLCASRAASWRSLRPQGVQLAFRRYNSSTASTAPEDPPQLNLLGHTYPTDAWTNLTPTITTHLSKNLHLQPNHPISITRSLIESRFPPAIYTPHNTLPPIVTTVQNFDSLGFPPDHPGRARSDTYYLNATHVLRTHTSAHQLDLFRTNPTPGFLVSADVYRRDAIDRSHYPVFHQMEAARSWDLSSTPLAEIEAESAELATLTRGLHVEDPNPPFHEQRNPLQPIHHPEAAAVVATHLKRSLESVVVALFGSAPGAEGAPIKVRWVEAYFPFTTPSWELEVLWQGTWLEVLGCGIVQHPILAAAGMPPSQIGWAFGIGLERIAMVLFGIPDIRLFWSRDERFLRQFRKGEVVRYQEISRFPAAWRDVSFWLPEGAGGAGGAGGHGVSPAGGAGVAPVHENDIMELVRSIAGDMVEDVALKDEFTHPKTGRKSLCYRIQYRSLERTMTSREVNGLHEEVLGALGRRLGLVVR